MPTRAKIVTRTATTSSNSTETLNKGSKLTFAEMDSNFIELQNQSIGIADDGSTVIDITAGNTLTVAGAGGIQTSVSGQTLTIDGSNLGTIGDLTVTGSTIAAPSNADLTLTNSGTGNINVDSNRITNLGTPSAGTDAATKDYVDSATSAVATEVVDDTTPQLGGNLDLNSKDITGTGNIDITGTIANQAITISQNNISATRSADDIVISASGGGNVILDGDAVQIGDDDSTGPNPWRYYSTTNPPTIKTPKANDDLVFQTTPDDPDIGGHFIFEGGGSPRMVLRSTAPTGGAHHLGPGGINGTMTIYGGGVAYENGVTTDPHELFPVGYHSSRITLYSDNGVGSADANIDITALGTGHVNLATELDMNSHKIINVTDPTSAQDAATKAYVDAGLSSVSSSSLGNLQVNNTTLSPITTNDDLILTANGTGDVHVMTDSGSLLYIGENKINGYFTVLPDSGILRYNTSGTGSLYLQQSTGGTIEVQSVSTDGTIKLTPTSGGQVIVGPTNNTGYISSNGAYDLKLWTNSGTNSGTITITDGVDGNISINPNGAGKVQLDNHYWPNADGTTGQILSTNGAGTLSWIDNTATTDPITFVGDDSTGTAVNTGETFKIAGATGITTAVSGDTLTITGTAQDFAFSSLTGTPTTIAGYGITDAFDGAYGSLTGTPSIPSALTDLGISDGSNGQVLTTDGAGGFTFTTVSGGGSTGDITFTGSTISSPSNADLTLTPGGTGKVVIDGLNYPTADGTNGQVLTTDGAGNLSFTTVSGGAASTGDFTFTGNTMTTSSSNADAEIEASGTGRIVLQKGNATGNLFTQTRYKGVINYVEDLTHTAGADRFVGVTNGTNIKLDGTASSSSNARFYNQNTVKLDMNGTSLTSSSTYLSRGARNLNEVLLTNSSATAADINNSSALQGYFEIADTYALAGNLTVDSGAAIVATNTIRNSNTSGITATLNNYYGVYSMAAQTSGEYNAGTLSITNDTGFYHYVNTSARDNNPQQPTNTYAFVTNYDKARSKLGALEKFNEYAYEATHSSGAGYTIDFNNGNLQAVTLSSNITSFTMSNFPTNSKHSAGVTLYLIQDGTGGRSITYTAGASETFKFANGTNTSSNTGAGDITVVYIFSRYNGSSNTYYWTLGPAYS